MKKQFRKIDIAEEKRQPSPKELDVPPELDL